MDWSLYYFEKRIEEPKYVKELICYEYNESEIISHHSYKYVNTTTSIINYNYWIPPRALLEINQK